MSIGTLVVFDPTKEFVQFIKRQYKKHTVTVHPDTDIISVIEIPDYRLGSFTTGRFGVAATLDGELLS